MPRRGRPRKAGKRTNTGQLSRAKGSGNLLPNRPSEWVQRQRERFGSYYSTALGRAYASGLLGAGSDAKVRLDAGNRFVLRYAKVFGACAYTCPLDRTPRGTNDNTDHERAMHQQQWLFAVMKRLDDAGLRPWLDQLIHRNYTDAGPYWLDALLAGGKQPADRMVLDTAIKALDCIAAYNEAPARQAVDIPLHSCNSRS